VASFTCDIFLFLPLIFPERQWKSLTHVHNVPVCAADIFLIESILNLRRKDADYLYMKQRVTRRAQRYPVNFEVKTINGKPVADTFVKDLSAMGARLESPIPLPTKIRVDLSFFLPALSQETRVAGAVVWVKPMVEAPGRYQMGLQFFNTNWQIDQMGRNGMLQ
jgi:hypothetical protein